MSQRSRPDDVNDLHRVVDGATEPDLFRRLFEENNAVMLLFDVHTGKFIDGNPAAAAFYGYPREQIRTLHVEDIIARPTADFYDDTRDIVERRKSRKFNSAHRLASGEVREVEVNSTPLVIDGRQAVFSIINDNTAELKAKQDLARSESLLREVVDSFPFDVWLCDAEGRYVLQNRISVENWGSHLGKRPDEVDFAAETRAIFLSNNSRALAGEVVTGEVTYVIGGEKRVYFNVLTPLRSVDGDGGVVGIVGVNVDVTERIGAEARLRSSLEEKEVLLHEVHHRVKNNLQVISSLLRLQADGVIDSRAREVFEEGQHRIRAMAIVHEQLYRSRNVAEVDFGGYLTTMTSQLIRTATDTRVKLQLDVEPIPLKVDVAIPCGLIVNELVTNALKHAFPPEMDAKVGSTGKPVEPTVSIGFHRRSASLLSLGVQDNGIGFSDLGDFREMTSMGMTLVNALVRQISATITVAEPTADSPHGSSFVIEFSP